MLRAVARLQRQLRRGARNTTSPAAGRGRCVLGPPPANLSPFAQVERPIVSPCHSALGGPAGAVHHRLDHVRRYPKPLVMIVTFDRRKSCNVQCPELGDALVPLTLG